jgi:hypothetical protein
MDTVVFSSLLIGLLTGVQPVTVEVSRALHPASVEFTLDGKTVARDSEPPWSANVDFGTELRPHVMAAIARDASGREVGRAVRAVNVPQAPARLEILVERNGLGVPTAARLVATSVLKEKPVRRMLSLDGAALALDEGGQAPLPRLDLHVTHVLSATAEFSADAVARADLAFGGGVSEEAGSRLTAVALRATGNPTPTLDGLRDALRGPEGPVRPVALDKTGATILFVRNPSGNEAWRRLGAAHRDYPLKVDPADRVGFIWPITREVEGGSGRTELFESMPPFAGKDGNFFWLLTRVSRPGGLVPPPYRFTDAVAVAGMQAGAAGTRRAVVLVEGDEDQDASQLSPEQVAPYLRSLGVPLHVWSLRGVGDTRWRGEHPEDISSFVALQLAVNRLKDDLASQRVAWVPGEWIPGQIQVTEKASGVELLR